MLPQPLQNESQQDFISRFIETVAKEDASKPHKQVTALAFSQWEDHSKKQSMTFTESDLHFSLAASVEVPTTSDNAKTSPVKLIANSGDPVSYPGKGNIVFDFASMTHKPKIQIDWEHEDTLGFLNKFDVTNGVLTTSGAIVPGEGKPAEFARDMITKMREGVPYEASIESHGGKLEAVAEGESANVNGRDLQGPFSILRNWKLAAVAICKFGKDSKTTAELRLAASKLKNGDTEMTDEIFNKAKLCFGRDLPSDLTKENAIDKLIALNTTLASKQSTNRTPPTSAELCFAGKCLAGEIRELMASGDITKATADNLQKKFVKSDIATLTLSRTPSNDDLAIYDGINTMLSICEQLKGAKLGLNMSRVRAADNIDDANKSIYDGTDKDPQMIAMKQMTGATK